MAYKPFHGRWADQLDEGKLEGLGQRLHDVGANVVHGALLDEGLKEPAMIQHDPTPVQASPNIHMLLEPNQTLALYSSR